MAVDAGTRVQDYGLLIGGEFVPAASAETFDTVSPTTTQVIGRMARAVRPGGHLVVDTFNAAFAVRHLEAGETYDVDAGVLHETAVLRGPTGDERGFDLWTTCWTPR